MIDTLLHAFATSNLPLTSEELADILWLASYMDVPVSDSVNASERGVLQRSTAQADSESHQPHVSKDEQSPSPANEQVISNSNKSTNSAQVEVHLPKLSTNNLQNIKGVRAVSFRSPAATALPGKLALARSLRPILRKVPSSISQELDEGATAEKAADEWRITPRMRPAHERWLDVTVVVDNWHTMVIWQQTIAEFIELLQQSGAFRILKTYLLSTKANAQTGQVTLQLYTSQGASFKRGRTCRPGELLDPSGRRLVLVLTDCTSPVWLSGDAGRLLSKWGSRNIVTLVQMLPTDLWNSCALADAIQVAVSAPAPVIHNAKLTVEHPWYWDDIWEEDRTPATFSHPVPVVTLEPEPLRRWTQVIIGKGGSKATAFYLPLQPVRSSNQKTQTLSDLLSPEERWRRFRANASPMAQELAGYLSAAPLSLPVIRLVQRVMVPTSRQVHLAEVLRSDLIEQATEYEDDILVDSDKIRYDFIQGVRKLLITTVLLSDTKKVLEEASKYISKQDYRLRNFHALILDPTASGDFVLDKEHLPFARVTGEVLQRIGGQYLQLAARLKEALSDDIQLKVDPSHIGEADRARGVRGKRASSDEVRRPKVEALGDNTVIAGKAAADFLRTLRVDQPDEEQLRKATEQYLELLLNRYRYLDFRGMGMADRVALRLPLVEMYVPLKARIEMPKGETWARELRLAGRKATEEEVAAIGERLSEPQPLLDLLAQHNGLVILGDPGAGKTTFLKYLALRLASGEAATLGLTVALGPRLPILVPLSAYANTLAEDDIALDDFLSEYYRKQGIHLPIDTLLSTALTTGHALIMLDGLDEIQALEQRTLVVKRFESFFAHYRQQGNKFLLTSRIVGYREVRPMADGLAECTLVDFDDEDIADFVAKWAHALERAVKGDTAVAQQEAEMEKAELLSAVEYNRGVRQLASNPLLLTILALMKRQGVVLPERRVQLYDRCIETLLHHWNLARGLDRRTSRDLDVVRTMRVLAPLALWMHQTSPGVGLVKREEMRRELERIYRARGETAPERAAWQLLADSRDHASLLLERGPGQYGFIHLTFQEYLAAVAIGQLGQSDVTPVAHLLASHVDDIAWHEVTLLTIGYMGIVQQRDVAAGETLLKLIEGSEGEPGAAVALAGEAVLDTWPGGVTQYCRSAVTEALLATMLDDQQVAPSIRARAGSTLGGLGDPRDLDEMVSVPAGVFTMGGRGQHDGKPTHQVDLPTFWISKYPVTNTQYAAFIAATGHTAPMHWRGGQPPPELRNHPVVYVSWHDAMAYCAWLSEVHGEVARLPTEAEWEKAARGTDGRIYPWGNSEPNANQCNFNRNIGTTTPVGIYLAGVSPYGCLDLSGNVLEWTSSLYLDYPYNPMDNREDSTASGRRVLRGGSFESQRDVRCTYRYTNYPDLHLDLIGFRIVSPNSSV